MSEALRSVFAEFGFHVDKGAFDALDARVKASSQKMEALHKTASGPTSPSGRQSINVAEIQQQMAVAKNAAVNATWNEKKLADAKAHKEALEKEAKAQEELTKKLSTYSGLLEHVSTKLHSAFGGSILARFPKIGAAAQRVGVNAEGMGKLVVGASAGVVGALHQAVTAAMEFATAFAADAEALRDVARESRVTTTQLQELDHAAVQGGVGAERMRAGVAHFGGELRKAERWGNGTTFMLRRLGIQARDASGHVRPTGELMDEVAVAMEHIQSPTRRARVAFQLFGESGRRMLDILHTGPGGIAALRAELAELGGGVTPEAVEASRQFTMATEKGGRALDSLRSVLAVALLPALTWVVTGLARAGGMIARLTNGTHVVQVALVALGVAGVAAAGALIVAWAPVVAPILAAAAVAAGLVLVLDDIITFAEGGDSAIGRMIDTIFGLGAAATVVQGLRLEWAYLKDVLQLVSDLTHDIMAVSSPNAIYQSVRGALGLSHEAAPQMRTGANGVFNNFNRARAAMLTAPDPGGAAQNRAYAAYSQTVTAPGAMKRGGYTKVTSHTNHNTFQLAGPDANQLADRVAQRLAQQAADQRDGNHPVEDDDE